MKKQMQFSSLEATYRASKLRRMLVLLLVLLLLSFSLPDQMQAQASNPADADPRRVPLAVLWNVALRGRDIAVGSDGNPVIAGSPEFTPGIRITKLNGATGAIVWDWDLESESFSDHKGIAIGPDGNPVVVTSDSSSGLGDGDFRIIKLNGNTGEIIWNIFATGSSNIKYDGATGEVLWILAGQGGHGGDGGGIAIGPDGKLIVTGQSTVKYDGSVNNILWVARADNVFMEGTLKFVAIGNDANPVVTGNFVDTGEPESPSGFQTIKYDGATGAVLWSAAFDSAGDDFANGIAVGLDGNPVVAGTFSSDSGGDFRLIKYDGATGAIIWNIIFDSGGFDFAQAVAIGPERQIL